MLLQPLSHQGEAYLRRRRRIVATPHTSPLASNAKLDGSGIAGYAEKSPVMMVLISDADNA